MAYHLYKQRKADWRKFPTSLFACENLPSKPLPTRLETLKEVFPTLSSSSLKKRFRGFQNLRSLTGLNCLTGQRACLKSKLERATTRSTTGFAMTGQSSTRLSSRLVCRPRELPQKSKRSYRLNDWTTPWFRSTGFERNWGRFRIDLLPFPITWV